MTTRVHVQWAGELRFDAGRPDGPTLRLDGSGATGPSPMDGLLSSLAGCMSADVVSILEKRRTPVSALTVDVTGERVETFPKRYKHITLHFTVVGTGLDQAQVEHAIELSHTKYCSVGASLRTDIVIEWTVDVRQT
ncbi:MAG TPA: OsmC family protein [Gemmatimonadaceae bacterium]|jgi:putative redox protein|nr:OsmC family protein [Gemmatimonadaceae bacterium]